MWFSPWTWPLKLHFPLPTRAEYTAGPVAEKLLTQSRPSLHWALPPAGVLHAWQRNRPGSRLGEPKGHAKREIIMCIFYTDKQR